MKKRILSIILSLVLCLGAMAATIPVGAETDTITMTELVKVHDNTVPNGVTKITISNADELKALSTYSESERTEGYTFLLISDIVLNNGNATDWAEGKNCPKKSWTPIGSVSQNPFKGNFDGQGHTISGMYIDATVENAGLFADIAKGGVSNVAITNAYIYSSNNNIGGLAGTVRAYSVTIENVYVDAIIETIRQNTGINVGGVVGNVKSNSNNTTTINNCVFTGSISGRAYVGGIVGETWNSQGTLKISNCANFGSVTGVAHSVAGIVGRAKSTTIESCLNAGNVLSTDGSYASGFAGRVQGGKVTFRNSYSCSDVIAEQSTNPANSYYGQIHDTTSTTYTNENCGEITTTAIKGLDAATVLTNLDWTRWTTTLSYPVPTSVAEMLYTPNEIYAQATTAEDDGTYSVRFLVAVDTLDYDASAFSVTATLSDGSTKDFFKNVDTAYTSVSARGTLVSATELGGKYLLAYAITGINEADAIDFEISVTVYSGAVKKTITRTFDDITAEEG